MKTSTLAVLSLALLFAALFEISAEHAFAPYSAAQTVQAYWGSMTLANRIKAHFTFSYKYENRDLADRYFLSRRDCGSPRPLLQPYERIFLVCRVHEGFDTTQSIVPEHYVELKVYAFANMAEAEAFQQSDLLKEPESALYAKSWRIFSTPESSLRPFSEQAIALH